MSERCAQWATVQLTDAAVRVDLSAARSIARVQDFSASGPRWFGAAPASRRPLISGSFNGEVARGASCNCSELHLTPHCNGTHTECVGHLTREALDVRTVVPSALLPALLLSVTPTALAACNESLGPRTAPDDGLVTRAALRAAWPLRLAFKPQALIVRTCTDTPRERVYWTAEAAAEAVARGVEHLLLETPSIDRDEDDGLLAAHRQFFGLPAGSTSLADARRAHCTITEYCLVDRSLTDGLWLLALQIPDLSGDALPSRPLLFEARS